MDRHVAGFAGATLLAVCSLALPQALAGLEPAAPSTADAGGRDIQRYKVTGPDTREERTRIARTGVAIDEVRESYVVITGSSAQAGAIERLGFETSALAEPLDYPPEDALYHDYAETVAELDQIAADHPDLAQRIDVGNSYEGRVIPGLKISDSVATDEDEPEVLFTANQHAREHLTPEMGLYVANLFTDEYGSDQAVKELVDSREIWIVPMVNPDGLEYDIDTGSYRMWRKNRQPNGGSYGTDLNRNWSYMWGCCGGSSGSPGAETYRGPAAESAPETAAVADFVRGRVVGGEQQIRAHIDFHTYGELVLWPMGYTYDDTGPDMSQDAHDTFATIGQEMAATNDYTPQQASDLYITDGSVDDWMWADQGIFSYTFEMYPVGGGFYPPDEVIERETSRNREAVLILSEYADCPYRAIGKEDEYC
jgi:carboxypeptidase T